MAADRRSSGKLTSRATPIIAAIGIIALVIGLVALVDFLSEPDRRSPAETAQQLVEAINDTDIMRVRNLFCSKDLAQTGRLEFDKGIRDDASFHAELISLDQNGITPKATISVTYKNEPTRMTWPLEKADDEWQFCGRPVVG